MPLSQAGPKGTYLEAGLGLGLFWGEGGAESSIHMLDMTGLA